MGWFRAVWLMFGLTQGDSLVNVALWPLLLYFTFVLAVAGGMIVIPFFLGQRHRDHATNEPYESGIVGTGSPRVQLSIQYYLIAMFFVVFDLEAVFIYAWAVSAKTLGWPGYISIAIFIGLLLVALVYLWRQGALEWGPVPRPRDSLLPSRDSE